MKKFTLDDCKKIANSKDGYCLSKSYHTILEKLKWQCDRKHIWYTSLNNVKNQDSWCPYCSKTKLKNPLKLCKMLAQKNGGKCLSTEYVNNTTKMQWQCEEGHIWEATYNNIKNNRWCYICNSRKLSLEYCNNIAKGHNGICLSDKYLNNYTNLKWQCKNNHIWNATIRNAKKVWCPKCRKIENHKKYLFRCVERAKTHNGECLSKEYKHRKDPLKWRCKKGHTWEAVADSILNQHTWCPKCANSIAISKPQREIYEILKNNFPNLDIELNNISVIQPKHLDIYISSLKFAIEFDGEYWHYSKQAIKRGSLMLMQAKDDKCKECGITLIRIRENIWNLDKGIIIQYLTSEINNVLNNYSIN